MIVVDTNVVAYLWIPGARTTHAEELLRRDPVWCAPLLWRSEFRNVLATYLRRKFLDLQTASQLMLESESHMAGREFAVPSDEVLRHAAVSGCSAYDCEFVVLAEQLGVPLITTDKGVLSSFPRVARALA